MTPLLSMQGRLNRAKYFWRTLIVSVSANVAAFLVGALLGGIIGEGAEPAALSGGFMLGLAAALMIAFEAVKRLHDLDRPGVHYWLLYIPFYNIYLGLLLLFKKGTSGPNQYGNDPLAAPQSEMAAARYAA